MNKKELYIKKFFQIKNTPLRDVNVYCPFHDDTNKSASLNFNKGLFNCFKSSCVGGLNFDQLYDKLQELREEKLDEDKLRKSIRNKIQDKSLVPFLKEKGKEYIESRGLTLEELPINYQIKENIQSDFYGYIALESINGYILARNILDKDPKYINQHGEKDLFWVSKDYSNKVIFLVEGVFDALTLYHLGIRNVVSTNGCMWPNKESVRYKWAYGFKDYTVLICYDNDPDGFKGSREVLGILKQFEVDAHILEMPKQLGNDLNEALVNNKDKLSQWLTTVKDKFIPDDTHYTHQLFRGKDIKPLTIIPTGLDRVDRLLTGGFKDGGHIISGETGVGKTSLMIYLAVNACASGKRCMINMCEIPKPQSWARIASVYSQYNWMELEEHPNKIEEDVYEKVKSLSKDLLVVNGWPLKRIVQESDKYDLIIIDYLQRVRETYSGDENAHRHLIKKYVSTLTDLGALKGKVVIMVSSLSRQAYDDHKSYGLKESGDLEYMGSSISRITPFGGGGNRSSFMWSIQKNTRGKTGVTIIKGVDLGHQDFSNAKTEEVNNEQ